MAGSGDIPKRRVGAYLRVSRIGGRAGDGYISVPLQRERLEFFSEYLGVEIPADAWFKDEDYSGGNVERPAFMEAIEAVERGDLGGLMVVRIDRFSRSVEDGVAMVDRLTKAGGMFASATESIDVREPVGRYMLVQMLNNAELQLNLLKAGWVDAKRRAVIKRGAHIGPTPFGYARIPHNAETGSGKLVPHPEHAPLLRAMFEMRADGRSYTDIARVLDAALPRAREWSSGWVKGALQRRVYVGEVHYIASERQRADGAKDLVNLKAHEPLVDANLFERVQKSIKGGAQKRPADGDGFLLASLIRCAHCRYAMGGFSYGGTKRDTPVYRCISRGTRCDHRPMINAAKIEEYVTDAFWTLMARRAQIALQEIATETAPDIDRLEAELADAIDEEDKFQADLANRKRIGEERWQRFADMRAAAREAAQAALDDAKRTATALEFQERRLDRDQTEREQLRPMLRDAIESVFVRRIEGRKHAPVEDRVRVVWATPGDERAFAVPTRSVSGPFDPIDFDEHEPPSGMAAVLEGE